MTRYDDTERDGRPASPIHEIYMPATPSLGPVRALAGLLSGLLRRRRERRRLRVLLAYDDARLADLGYRRADLRRALRLPLCCNTWAAAVGHSKDQRSAGKTGYKSAR